MKNLTLIFSLLLLVFSAAKSQDEPTAVQKQKAKQAVINMRDSGLVVVRLKTEARAIQVLQAVLNRKDLKTKQRERHQGMLDGIVRQRDEINYALTHAFLDSFRFCPVYFCYDTSARSLYNGVRQGILWQWQDSSLQRCEALPEARPHLFTAYYREAGGEYPYDALVLRRVQEELSEPFPVDSPLRSSFVNESKERQIWRAINGLDNRLRKFYEKVK